jgi:hypothetical protein
MLEPDPAERANGKAGAAAGASGGFDADASRGRDHDRIVETGIQTVARARGAAVAIGRRAIFHNTEAVDMSHSRMTFHYDAALSHDQGHATNGEASG